MEIPKSERSSPGKTLQAEDTVGTSLVCLRPRREKEGAGALVDVGGGGGPMSGPDCAELCKSGKGI